MRRRPTPPGWISARVSYALALCLMSGSIFMPALNGAPNRRGRTVSNASETAVESKTETLPQAPTGPMVLSRRIVTKVDGVIVEDHDTAVPPIHYLPLPLGQLPQNGGSTNTKTSDLPLPETKVEVAQESTTLPEEQAEGGFFQNFFNPQKDANPGGNRGSKRHGTRVRNPQAEEIETVEQIAYEPIVLPEEQMFIGASPNVILGKLVSINPIEGIAVAWMDSRFISLEREVITRNHELEITGLLSPTNFRNGRAYGLRIVGGAPNIGDEVVLPEPLEN